MSDWATDFCARAQVDLKPLTTVRVGGTARHFVCPESAAATAHLLHTLREQRLHWRVLGGGSNLLIADGIQEAVVIHPSRLDTLEQDGAQLTFGAGYSLQRAVNQSLELGLAGAQVLTGIPGQIGGAACMNAGGRYGEMAELVDWIEVACGDGKLHRLPVSDLSYGYRHSELPEGAVITRVSWSLKPSDDPRALRREAGRILKEKNAAQPTQAWNFGCMFKNPPGQSAGKLIEASGLKGATLGDARISPRHGNFIENLGSARAADILGLMEQAEAAVLAAQGIRLQREVRVWD